MSNATSEGSCIIVVRKASPVIYHECYHRVDADARRDRLMPHTTVDCAEGEEARRMEAGSLAVPRVDTPECVRDMRRAVTLPGFALLGDGATFSVTLLDLTYDGCKIETPVALLPKLKLKLSVLRLGALDAHVRWYKDGQAGLQFAAAAKGEKTHKPRAPQRLEIAAEVSLRRLGRVHYQGRLFDLSPQGCRVEFIERPRVGERIWVKFDGLDLLEAEVRWIDGFIGGVEFVRPIYDAVFDLLVLRLK